ncbi:FtsX-like permease family protein [Spirochaetia bacterium 38H-sp]|uniref:FtsX-like permease family protein n=1 Tax=Rarispira pelagica TaxID=3141764 RepID=A0ABU9UA45_9SPIR
MKIKKIILLSFKNLTRYTRRTIITASAIAVGILIFIVADSILKGAEVESQRNLIEYETGAARVYTENYWAEREKLPLKESIENPQALIKELQEQGFRATTRTEFIGDIVVYKDPYPENGSMQVRIIAIDPDKDTKVFSLNKNITEGSWLSNSEEEDGIIMGAWLAEDIGAKVGYPITISTRTKYGASQTLDLVVKGIVNTNNPVINRTGIYIPKKIADRDLEMGESAAAIIINFSELANQEKETKRLKNYITEKHPNLHVATWQELAPSFVSLAQAKQGGTKVVLIFLFVIAAVGISNTMLMSIYERFREIGMMRAMGMSNKQIGLSFIIEAAGIGLIGAAIGVLISIPTNIWLVNYGIDYSFLTRKMDIGYRVAGAFKGTWDITSFIQAFFMGSILATVVAIFPVRRAFKKSIVDCLRYQ